MASKPPGGLSPFSKPPDIFDRRLKSLELGHPPGPSMSAAAARGIGKYRSALQNAAAREGLTAADFNAFMAYWAENELNFAQRILDFHDAPDNAIEILKLFSFFRRLGLTVRQMTPAFVLMASLRSPTALTIMHHIAAKGPGIATKLKPLGGSLKALAIFIAAVETYNLATTNQWSQALAKVYTTAMGLAIPWAGAVDAFQSFFPNPSPVTNAFFKVLRVCNPIGLGGTGVDAMVTLAQSFFDAARGRAFNEQRLAQLVERIKSGPTRALAEYGERSEWMYKYTKLLADLGSNAASNVKAISEMDAHEWRLIGRYSISQLHDFILGNDR